MTCEGVFNVQREDGRCYQYNIQTKAHPQIVNIREKEIVHGWQALRKSDGRPMIDVRVYTGRGRGSSTHYAIVWLHDDITVHGAGKAGGYGYNKSASAICHALRDLGVASDVRDMADSGDIVRALEVMYRDIFDEDCFVVEFYA